MNPPERITPLPWRLVGEGPWIDGADNLPVALGSILGPDSPAYPFERMELRAKTNAAYIVHCANNYPKLEALNAELVERLEAYKDFLEHAPVSLESGVCCCGDDMKKHYASDHSAVDSGAYSTGLMIKEINALITKAKGGVSG